MNAVIQDQIHTTAFQAEAGRDYQIAVITAYPNYKLTLLLTGAEALLTLKKGDDNAPMRLDLMTLSQRDWPLRHQPICAIGR